MARQPSVILTKQELKAEITSVKSDVKQLTTDQKAAIKARKVAEVEFGRTVRNLDREIEGFNKSIMKADARLQALSASAAPAGK